MLISAGVQHERGNDLDVRRTGRAPDLKHALSIDQRDFFLIDQIKAIRVVILREQPRGIVNLCLRRGLKRGKIRVPISILWRSGQGSME